MIEPNGPLPPSVYWRRRALAGGASVLAIVLLAWFIGDLVDGDDQGPAQETASTARLGASRSVGAGRFMSTRGPRPSATAGPHADGSLSEADLPATEPEAAPATILPPPASGPPGPCDDPVVKVAGIPDAPSYPVGARPLLRLQVTNVGPVPCTRDMSRALREILVLGPDGARLWSSNDCYGPPDEDVRVLPVNRTVEFSVNWAGRTSKPGCPTGRVPVQAGNYQVVGRLGTLLGQPAPLVLT